MDMGVEAPVPDRDESRQLPAAVEAERFVESDRRRIIPAQIKGDALDPGIPRRGDRAWAAVTEPGLRFR